MRLESVLEAARDADWWESHIRTDADGQLEIELCAGFFNTLMEFVPPTYESRRWHWSVGYRQLDSEDPEEFHDVGTVSAPELIDTVPQYLEQWVLAITEHAVDSLEAEVEEEASEDAGRTAMRLRAELDQAHEHSRKWQARSLRRYGDVMLYDLPPNAEIEWQEGDVDGIPALLAFPTDGARPDRAERAMIAPDWQTAWRWTTPDRAGECGEYLPVHEVLAIVGEEYQGWVREQTAVALGHTLTHIREIVNDPAARSAEPEIMEDLAKAAEHAKYLAVGVRAEPFRP